MLALTLLLALNAPPSLAKGDVIVTVRPIAGSSVSEASAQAIVEAPPEAVWALVSDCANYKNTMPNILSSDLVKHASGAPLPTDGPLAVEIRSCRVVADLPFPFPDLVSQTRGVHTIDPGKQWRRQWKLTVGDYTRNDGSWTVVPYGDDGKRSLVTYRIHAEPKVPLPGSLLTSIQEAKLPEMIANVRKLVKK